jgi:hypothetical protein
MWTIGFADRLHFPRLPSQARKAGKCSPSPTYPQAASSNQQTDIDRLRGKRGIGHRPAKKPLTEKAPYKDGFRLLYPYYGSSLVNHVIGSEH